MSYIILKCALYPIGIMPRWALRLLSDAVSFLIYHLIGYRKTVVMSNLRRCFPDKTNSELRQIARRSYTNLCDLMLNMLRIRFASQKRIMRSVHFVNPEVFTNTKNQDGIVLAAHYSCWEYIGLSQFYMRQHQSVAAYQPSHGAIDRIITEGRGRFGAIMSALRDVFRTIFTYRNEGKLTYTLMVSDQSPAAHACDFYLTFLGQHTPVFVAPERIAQKTGSVVLYLRVREIRRFYYEYELVPLTQNAALEEPHSIIRRFFAELEKDILRSPPLWMWTHHRWKHA